MQSLSRSRDENLVVDIESALRLAHAAGPGDRQRRAAAGGAARPASSAWRARRSRGCAPLQRAVARDADRIQAAPAADIADALQKLDDLVRLVDDLPLLNAVASAGAGAQPAGRAQACRRMRPGGSACWPTVRQEARSLVRVSRIDRPEAVLVAPEQVFFLRENLKLKLLNARLALLSRQIDTARNELAGVHGRAQPLFRSRARAAPRPRPRCCSRCRRRCATSERAAHRRNAGRAGHRRRRALAPDDRPCAPRSGSWPCSASPPRWRCSPATTRARSRVFWPP